MLTKAFVELYVKRVFPSFLYQIFTSISYLDFYFLATDKNLTMDKFILTFLNFKFKILSLGNDITSCESECNRYGGHLPYQFEGKGLQKWMFRSDQNFSVRSGRSG